MPEDSYIAAMDRVHSPPKSRSPAAMGKGTRQGKQDWLLM
jgi:hypothetical protein